MFAANDAVLPVGSAKSLDRVAPATRPAHLSRS
jgi:hypothetical protein